MGPLRGAPGMTRHNAIQEFVIMGLLLAVVGVVFLETGGGAPAAPGQLPPSAFPRLAGSVIAVLAAMRIFLILVARTERRATKIWRLRSFGLRAC